MKKAHTIELTIDGKTIKTRAKDLLLKIDNLLVYKLPEISVESEKLQTVALRSLLQSANAAFGHDERFNIIRNLAESPKTFSEIKEIFNMPSSTLDFHLKKLTKEWVVYKQNEGQYAMTLLGELLLDYFSKFLNEAAKLQESIHNEKAA